MTNSSFAVNLTRVALGQYVATNARGASIEIGTSDHPEFTPVELLLAAIAACSAVDVDFVTTRRAEPEQFDIVSSGVKSTEGGNHMEDLSVAFTLKFPAGEAGDAARARVDAAVRQSHDRLCTVSRTVQLGTPVAMSSEVS